METGSRSPVRGGRGSAAGTGKLATRRRRAWLWPLVAPAGLGLAIGGMIAAPAIVSPHDLPAQVASTYREIVSSVGGARPRALEITPAREAPLSPARAAVSCLPPCREGGVSRFQSANSFPLPGLGWPPPTGWDGLRTAVDVAEVFRSVAVSDGPGTGGKPGADSGLKRSPSAPLASVGRSPAKKPGRERACAVVAYAETARGQHAARERDHRQPRPSPARPPLAQAANAPHPTAGGSKGVLGISHPGRQGILRAA